MAMLDAVPQGVDTLFAAPNFLKSASVLRSTLSTVKDQDIHGDFSNDFTW